MAGADASIELIGDGTSALHHRRSTETTVTT